MGVINSLGRLGSKTDDLQADQADQPNAGRTIHVAPDAASGGDGSLSRPFRLTDAITALRGKAAGATVLLRGGDYHISSPVVLTAADGGSPGAPVMYRSYPGEQVRLLGGCLLYTSPTPRD